MDDIELKHEVADNTREIDELKERINNLEKHIFGFTRLEAQQYLDRERFKQNTMSPEEYDNHCSRSINTTIKAEQCLDI